MSLNDLLTPEELEALLREVDWGRFDDASSQDEVRDAIPYDFSAQERIVRSSMPTLEMIYEKFSRQLRTTLSGVLRRGASVDLGRVESLRYADWFAQLPPRCGMHLVKVHPLHGTGLFVLPPRLVYLFVDSYFGGRAEEERVDEEGEEPRREITAAELRITRIVIDRIAKDLERAWAPVFKIAIEHAGVETNPLFASIASPPERVIAARFGIRLGSLEGELSFVIPYSMVEPIKALLDNGMLTGHSDVDLRWRDKLVENLLNVPLELRGTLVETIVPVRRILTMKTGDVIPIDIPKQLPIDLEGSPTFRGALGSARGRNAVKITQVLRKDGESTPEGGPSSPGSGARGAGDAPVAGSPGRKQQGGMAAYA